MKKIFLSIVVAGIAITSSAQQNDFIDLQLQKIKKEKTKSTRPVLPNPLLERKVYNFHQGSTVNPYTLSHTLPNGDKVYLLKGDNMPCVVPDMSRFKIAGVFGKSEIPLSSDKVGSIPNVAIKPKANSR